MPRPTRIHLEGALYYVTSRGEPEAPLFRDEQDVRTYLDLLSFYKVQYRFKLFAYTLSASLIQLCLEATSGVTVSQIMHALNSRYTKIYGKRYHRSGHLFQGRYRATVLEKEPSLAPLTRYLHAQADALATSLPQYQRPDSSWLDREDLLRRFTRADLREKAAAEEARKAYGLYVQSAVPEELEEWRRMLEQPAIGSPGFLRAVEQAKAGRQEHAADTDPEEEPVLVPVPVRRGGGPWRKLLSAAAILGFLYSVGSVAFLSGIVVKQAESNKRVQVVIQAAAPNIQQASAVHVSEPPAVPVMATPVATELNGTQWQIQIAPMYARNGSVPVQEDHVTFEGNQMSSSTLNTQGFPKSNITLTPQEDGRLVWETMQTHSNGETVFWRGEMKEGRMQGVFSRHPKDGAPIDFIFRGIPRDLSEPENGRTL